MDKSKIIDITSRLPRNECWQKGFEALSKLGQETANDVISFVFNYVMKELELGLGLAEFPDGVDEDKTELKIFEQINGVYEKFSGGCYFCSNQIDPNADEFGPKSKLCMMCKLKLANFLESLEIPAGSVFKGMRPRRVQRSRIVR